VINPCIYKEEDFPLTFAGGHGVTPFKAYYEFALGLLYIALAIVFWRHAGSSGQSRDYLLAASSS
jgi:hypothetical protein